MNYIMKLQSKISLEPKLLLDIIENMSTAVVALNNDNPYFFINIAGLNMLGISNNFPDIKRAMNIPIPPVRGVGLL